MQINTDDLHLELVLQEYFSLAIPVRQPITRRIRKLCFRGLKCNTLIILLFIEIRLRNVEYPLKLQRVSLSLHNPIRDSVNTELEVSSTIPITLRIRPSSEVLRQYRMRRYHHEP